MCSWVSVANTVHVFICWILSQYSATLPLFDTKQFVTAQILCMICRLSASCTHVSALLHALVAMTPTEFLQHPIPSSETTSDETENLPVASYPCQWKQPKKRKESTLRMGDTIFEKHVLGREHKRKLVAVEDFDPRPPKYRGTAKEHLPELLEKVRGQGLCVSLLLDPNVRHWDNSVVATPSTPLLPGRSGLADTIAAFKESLKLPEEKIKEIELRTRNQRESNQWFEVRRYRLTSSLFGQVLRRRSDTPPRQSCTEHIATQTVLNSSHLLGHYSRTYCCQ